MEEKDDKKAVRRRAKEFRKEFCEKYGYVEVDPKPQMRLCCAEALDAFDPQTHEAWLMQCPKGIDVQQLAGKQIKLPGRRYVGDLQVRASNYKEPLQEAIGYVNSKGKYALRKMPLTGYVVVSKRLNTIKPPVVPEGHDPLGPGSGFPFVPPPPKFNPPVRHPFFGRDYKKHIELPPKVAEALKKADEQNIATSAYFRRHANYYTIKSKMLKTTQTLEEKELEVRQSVLTGIRPKFMSSTAAPSISLDGDPVVKIKQEREETNAVVQMNGQNLVKIKEEPTTPKKQKKKKSNGEIPVNGTSLIQDSSVTIKEEPGEVESQPEKKKKQKKKKSNEEIPVNGTSNPQDSLVTIKEEPGEVEPQPEKKKKQKKKKSNEEILVNETSNLQDSVVTIKEDPEFESQPEKKKKQKKKKSDEEILVNGTSNLEGSVVTIKEEPDSKSPPEKRKKRKRSRGESVSIDENVVVKQEEEDAVAEATPRKKKKKIKAAD